MKRSIAVFLRTRVLIALAVAWMVFRFVRDPRPPTVRDFLLVGPLLVVSWLIAWFTSLRVKPTGGPSPLAALLAAHRVCGACGYDLHQINSEPDGCAVCPECGAAWHRDRFVLADRDPKESAVVRALMDGGHMFPRRGQIDDRRLPLDQPLRWPPAWLDRLNTPSGAAKSLRSSARGKLRHFLMWALPLGALAWGGLIALFTTVAEDRDAAQVMIICVVTLIIAAVAVWTATRIYIDRAMGREAVDALGLCDNCGSQLPTDAVPGFDGCIVCGACKRAWRLTGAGTTGARATA